MRQKFCIIATFLSMVGAGMATRRPSRDGIAHMENAECTFSVHKGRT
jgi:hypothetical protein